jgi:hypothetical protein
MEILKIKGNKTPANRCDVKTLEGCSEKDTKYINKYTEKEIADIEKEMKRLKGMDLKKLADGPAGWVSRRLSLLSRMTEL